MSKVNNVLFDNAEDLYIVIPMCSLTEYSKIYRKKAGRLEDYYTDVPNNPPIYPSIDYNPPTISYNADPVTNSASFKYKSSIMRKIPNKDNNVNNKKNGLPLKHLSKFWRTLDIPLINCEINLILTWPGNCILTDMILQTAVPQQGNDPARSAINAATNTFSRKVDTKLYLSTQDNNKLSEQNGIKTDQKCLSKPNLILPQI